MHRQLAQTTRRVAASVVLLLASIGANANLVTNGGFENGNLSGWTPTGNTGFQGVQCPGPGPTVAQGNCSAFFGPIGSTGGISQAVGSLIAGNFYDISFAFLPDGGNPSSFSASFGGVPLLSLNNPPAGPFQTHIFQVQATAASEVLSFVFRDDPGFLFLDAVSVDQSRVPEPATLALLGLGLAGLATARRRKR